MAIGSRKAATKHHGERSQKVCNLRLAIAKHYLVPTTFARGWQ